MSNDVYTTAQVCKLLKISKSTLFRWENEDKTNLPALKRSQSNQTRIYTRKHVDALADRYLSQQFRWAFSGQDFDAIHRVFEEMYLKKATRGDMSALVELRELPKLSTDTLEKLLDLARRHFSADSEFFDGIIDVIHDHRIRQRQWTSPPR